MGIGVDFVELLATNIAHHGTTPAHHFIATITLDKWCGTFGTFSNLGLGHGFFNLEPPLILSFLLHHLFTTKRDVRLFATFSA